MFTNGSDTLCGISRLSEYESRSVSAENITGEKGRGGMATEGTGAFAARDLGKGWKVSPALNLIAHSVTTLADISGEGAIRHIWLTPLGGFRSCILRIYWDGSEVPSIECPISDFFASANIPCTGATEFKQISSLAVCVNPRFGMNCYWDMPFRKSCRVTVENLADTDKVQYYKIDYVLPFATLCAIRDRIIATVPGVNRVAWDISEKPVSTIEFE